MSDGRPSIRDVAARAGVSVTTVSRILNGSYPPAPKTRDKVLRAVQELDYVANPHARALTRQGTGTIALVVMMLDDGFLMSLVESIATGVAEAGKLCLIGTSGGNLERELAVLRQMHAQHVEAIILVGAVVESDEYREQMGAFAAQLRQSGTRLVLCARPPIDTGFQDASVEYDNEGGAYAATSHLLSRGHRRILLLGGPDGQSITTRRTTGYRKALRDLGGDLDPDLEIHPAWNRETGYARVREVLDAGPPTFTGILAHNDHVAAGAWTVVVGTAITHPTTITTWFVNAVQ